MSGGDFRQSSALQMYLRVRTNRLKANVIEPAIQNHICLFFKQYYKIPVVSSEQFRTNGLRTNVR